jgi:multidrug efflux pump
MVIPKGFFPVQDTGVIQGISEAPQSSPSPRWPSGSRRWPAILKDPDVDSLSSFIGVDGTNTTLNSGRFLINLKPATSAARDTASEIIRRLQQETAAVPASRSTCSRCRT